MSYLCQQIDFEMAKKKTKAEETQLMELEVTNCNLKNINIEAMIRVVRGVQVMLDSDLAMLYGVETRELNQAVKRNIGRFPSDFMFQLNKDEWNHLKSQIAISKPSDNQVNSSVVR